MSQLDQEFTTDAFSSNQNKNRLRFYSQNFVFEEESQDQAINGNKKKMKISSEQFESMYSTPEKNLEVENETFIIDVRPKKKFFLSPEEKKQFINEYSKKKKTELCKNYQVTGYCKFGVKCSFAHGYDQLQGKQHLHSNYRTKPCKKYFNNGYCQYGVRCQYMHYEIINKPEYREYLDKIYQEKQLYLPSIENCGTPIKRFQSLQKFCKLKNPYFDDTQFIRFSKRLSVFEEICFKQKETNDKCSMFSNSQFFTTMDVEQNQSNPNLSKNNQNIFQFDEYSDNSMFKGDDSDIFHDKNSFCIWGSLDQNSSFFSIRELEYQSESQNQQYQHLY